MVSIKEILIPTMGRVSNPASQLGEAGIAGGGWVAANRSRIAAAILGSFSPAHHGYCDRANRRTAGAKAAVGRKDMAARRSGVPAGRSRRTDSRRTRLAPHAHESRPLSSTIRDFH